MNIERHHYAYLWYQKTEQSNGTSVEELITKSNISIHMNNMQSLRMMTTDDIYWHGKRFTIHS
jgi:hypothetical protein